MAQKLTLAEAAKETGLCERRPSVVESLTSLCAPTA